MYSCAGIKTCHQRKRLRGRRRAQTWILVNREGTTRRVTLRTFNECLGALPAVTIVHISL